MKHIAISAAVGAVVVATLIASGAVTSAQGPNKCLAGKNKCASKEMQGKLKCHNLAEKTGVVVSPPCIQKADDKYTGGAVPAKGCFAKLELKNDGPCLTTSDSTAIGSKGDAFVLDVVIGLHHGFPTAVMNKCSAGKKKCVLQKAAAILKCHEKAVKAGMLAADPICLQKAHDKFDDPVKGCFAKLEAKGDCLTTGDTAALEAKVDSYTTDVLCELGYTTLDCAPTPTPTPTFTPAAPTPTPTATFVPGLTFQGALTQTTGRFTYTAMIGIPGSDALCNTKFPGSHTCTYAELQTADAANEFVLANDGTNFVTSFWAINAAQPGARQCFDDLLGGTLLPWGYQTAHTVSRGDKVPLASSHLGILQLSTFCITPSWVGCCL